MPGAEDTYRHGEQLLDADTGRVGVIHEAIGDEAEGAALLSDEEIPEKDDSSLLRPLVDEHVAMVGGAGRVDGAEAARQIVAIFVINVGVLLEPLRAARCIDRRSEA